MQCVAKITLSVNSQTKVKMKLRKKVWYDRKKQPVFYCINNRAVNCRKFERNIQNSK